MVKNKMNNRMMNLLVGVITNDNKVSIQTHHSIISYFDIKDLHTTVMSLNSNGIDVMTDYNNLFTLFVTQSQYQYLLFLKGDHFVNVHHLIQMISSGKDLIYHPPLMINTKQVKEERSIVKSINVDFVSTLLSRKLAIDIANYADRNHIVYSRDPNYKSGEISEKDKVYNVFNSRVSDNNFISGYMDFCQIVKSLKYEIYSCVDLKLMN